MSRVATTPKVAWKGKDKKKSLMGRLRLGIKEYNDETSLHGPKYITEDGNRPIERYLKIEYSLALIKFKFQMKLDALGVLWYWLLLPLVCTWYLESLTLH